MYFTNDFFLFLPFIVYSVHMHSVNLTFSISFILNASYIADVVTYKFMKIQSIGKLSVPQASQMKHRYPINESNITHLIVFCQTSTTPTKETKEVPLRTKSSSIQHILIIIITHYLSSLTKQSHMQKI